MPYRAIAQLAVTGQALNVLSSAVPKKGKKPAPIKTGVNLLIGTTLLRPIAANVAAL